MVSSSDRQQRANNLLINLARVMAGDFSNAKQSQADPKNYAHIRVFFRPLPWGFFSAIGFYSEQTYDYDLWTPYRQGIHRLVPLGDCVYIENYSLEDGMVYAGAGHNREILETITPESIARRHNCSMIFHQEGNLFRGTVEGKECKIVRNGIETYLISEVEITDSTWIGWDRGISIETGEQIWGSAIGPLKFEKRLSFADELPLSDFSK